MSYARMDHARWLESNIAAVKQSKRPLTAAQRRRLAEDKGWHAAPDKLNPFQRQVATIIGIVGGGIYNAPVEWERVTWGRRGMHVPWRGYLDTFDFNRLTMLVLLAHEARIRVGVEPHTMREVVISFFARRHAGDIGTRHPSIDEAVASFRAYLGPDHPITYQGDQPYCHTCRTRHRAGPCPATLEAEAA